MRHLPVIQSQLVPNTSFLLYLFSKLLDYMEIYKCYLFYVNFNACETEKSNKVYILVKAKTILCIFC